MPLSAEQREAMAYIEGGAATYDVVVKRWQAFTGRVATLEGDDRSFDAIAAERVPDTADTAKDAAA